MTADHSRLPLGGIVHTYQKYDPVRLPGPNQPPPDLVSPLMNQLLAQGRVRSLTEEELAQAIRLTPEQFAGLGPGIDMIRAMLEERKRRILARWETASVLREAGRAFRKSAQKSPQPPEPLRSAFREAIAERQLFALEQVWFQVNDDQSPFARHLVGMMERLGELYEVEELAASYAFTGREELTVPEALAVKAELEKIDELLKKLDEAEWNGQVGYLDLDELKEFVEPQNMQALEEMQRTIENYVREQAERQGLVKEGGKFSLSPAALRLFQGKLLSRIFSGLQAGRSGRHHDRIEGDGVVELEKTRAWEFGDSTAHLDLPQSFTNAIIRQAGAGGQKSAALRLDGRDLVVHATRNSPKCATAVIMDMSGSMRYGGQYIQVKRMALALDGLIRTEYPGDWLGFVEMSTFARIKRPGEVAGLMPKPVTVFDPVVQLRVDMSREGVSEHMVHQHFTNIQHGLAQARRLLAAQDAANRQVILITDGLPTAHFDGSMLYMLYPPHPLTEQATLREGLLCQRQGIVINLFLIESWSQSEEDVRFAQRLAQSTGGRVFFPGGEDLDRFVVWDYVKRKRELLR